MKLNLLESCDGNQNGWIDPIFWGLDVYIS
ncbi:uncharacterized protein METZ01_LOCUS388950 [marine metagenome]|uniref:Uncharacterized protein n=1 Tax=marine metagenome TaxID=408172 RepID=A0A382UP92_9ZZZZ